jgi:hypothetical protein
MDRDVGGLQLGADDSYTGQRYDTVASLARLVGARDQALRGGSGRDSFRRRQERMKRDCSHLIRAERMRAASMRL